MHAPSEPLDTLLAGTPDLARLPGRDLVEVARYLIPLEANLVQGCLVASGVPAVLADAHLVQQDRVQEAQAVLEAFARGEFALGEDADVGSA